MTTTRLAIAALLIAVALSACPPEAPLPDNTALLIINNVRASGDCYETNTQGYDWRGFHVLCRYEIFSVTMKGPKDIGFGPERLGKTEVISPGESRTFAIDLSGNAIGDWAVRATFAYLDDGTLGASTHNLTLEDVQPGDVYNWNWGASQ